MEMFDFPMLTLSDIERIDVPKLPNILLGYEEFNVDMNEYIDDVQEFDIYSNGMINSVSIDDLLIIIYSYEDADITFENLLKKMIDFYFEKANDKCLLTHLRALDISVEDVILTEIYDNSVYSNYSENSNLNVIIEFISSSFGYSYLLNIYNTKCLWF